MKADFIVNGTVTLLLSPDNAMEEELLKQITKQDVEVIDVRSTLHLINRTIKSGVIISSKTELTKLPQNAEQKESMSQMPTT